MQRRSEARRKPRRAEDARLASDDQPRHADTGDAESDSARPLFDADAAPTVDEPLAVAPLAESAGGAAPQASPDAGRGTPAESVSPGETDALMTAADAPMPSDELVFADAPEAARARLVLPSSGLAADILRAAEGELADSTRAAAEPPLPGGDAAAARAHQFTFFAAPEREAREQPEATEHLVTFVIDREEYGVDVRLVQEIIRVPAITPVPRAPAFAKGVINLRGRIIPVMDFKAKLGLGQVDAAQRKARILVVRLKGRLIGLLVDGASQVLKVPVSSIDAAPEEVLEVDAGHIRGVAKLRDRLVILVDLMQVLAGELRAAGATS